MKSQFAGIILFSLILVFVISFGHINPAVSFDSGTPYGPENLMLMTSYYVSPSPAGNDEWEGTIERPWATISHAMWYFNYHEIAGYTLNVAAGTYDNSFSVSNSGDATQKNEIIGYGGDVILSPTTPPSYIIEIDGKSNIKISGLTVTSSTSHGVYVHGDSDNIELDNISISSLTAGAGAGICVEGCVASHPDNVDITNCTIDGDSYGVYVNTNCVDVTVSGNEISSCDEVGVYVYSNCDSIIIENNQITTCDTAGISVYSNCDSGSIYNNEITLGTSTYGVKVASNCQTWYLTENELDVTTGTYGFYFDCVINPIIFNNMIDGSYSQSIVYDQDTENFSMNYNSLRNKSTSEDDKGYYGSRSTPSLSSYVASFHNNIVALGSANGYVMYIAGTCDYWIPESSENISNNLYFNGAYCGCIDNTNLSSLSNWQAALGTSYDDNSLREDPDFISSTNLHLDNSTPCFGEGISISGISTDIDGHYRNSTNPNMGADEFDSLTIANGQSITINWDQVEIDVTVQSGGTLNLTDPSSGIEVNFGTLNVYGVVVVSGSVIIKSTTLNVYSGGEVQVGDVGIEIRAIDLTINSDGKITADGKGYAAGEGPGAGTDSTNYGAGGGAYGGDGGTGGCGGLGGAGGSASSYTAPYLFYYPHLERGSGGGDGNGTTGGAGGGSIYIEVFDTLTLNGEITADGLDGGSDTTTLGATGAGGGAGGGILIFVDTLTGTGTISADGGAGGAGYNDLNCGGPAGGGREATYARVEVFDEEAKITVTKGDGCPCSAAFDGTIEYKTVPPLCKKGTCCDSNAAISSGPFGNEFVSLDDLCLVTEYDVTHLDFNDSVSRNLDVYYGSMNGINSGASPFGTTGWTHSLNESLDVTNANTEGNREITYRMLCGAQIKYQDINEDGTFVAPPFYGDQPNIVEGDDIYTMTSKDGTERIFDSEGNWLSFTDTMGNTMSMSYNESGLLDHVEMADGRAIGLSYDGSNRVSSVSSYETVGDIALSNPVTGSTVSFSYTGNDLTGFGDWDFTYDGNGLLNEQMLEYESSNFRVTDFDLSASGKCNSIKDPMGNSVSYSRSQLDHTTTVQDRNGKNWTYKWDSQKKVVLEAVDPIGNVWEYEYDDKRRLIKSTPPFQNEDDDWNSYTEYTYDAKGNLLTVYVRKMNDPNNHFIYSEYEYDSYNNMTASYGPVEDDDTKADGDLAETQVLYNYFIGDGLGNGLITADGTTVTCTNAIFGSDVHAGDTITVQNFTTVQTRTVVSITDSTHLVIDEAFTFTVEDKEFYINKCHESFRKLREIKRRTGLSTYFVTRYEYDLTGKMTSVTQNDGGATERVIEYEYYEDTNFSSDSIAGFLETSRVVVPGGTNLETEYSYYWDGAVKQVTDQTGLVTQYIYDYRGRVIQTCVDPSGYKLGVNYEYNFAGDLTSLQKGTWLSWSTISTNYINESTAPYSQIDYKYDSNGRLIASKNRLDLGSIYTYDSEGNTTFVTSGYFTNFSTPAIQDTGSDYSQTGYEYLDNGSLEKSTTKLDGSNNAVVSYTYLPNGNIEHVEGPEYDDSSHQMESGYEYDYVGRVIKSKRKKDEGPTYINVEIGYDAFGRVAWQDDELDHQTSYTYENYTRRLTKTAVVMTGPDLETDYTYNDFGQITMITYAAQGTNSEQIYKFNSFDNLGRLEKSYIRNVGSADWNSGVNRVGYSYDTVGRMYKKTIYDIEDGDSVETEYHFDDLNRVVSVCTDKTDIKEGAKYTYDELSRVTKIEQGTFSDFSANPLTITTLRTTKSVYDEIGRLTHSILNPVVSNPTRLEDITTYYDYDSLSRVVKVVDPQQWFEDGSTGKHTEYVYDNASRLTEVNAHIGASGGTTVKLAKYEYFNNGARKRMSYTQEHNTDWVDVDYEYYPTGWLKAVEYPGYNDNNDRYVYNYYDTGALSTVSLINFGYLFQYDYDDAWRLSSIEDSDSVTKQFVYNDRSQITEIQNAATTEYEYDYDVYGRVSSTTDSTTDVFDTVNKTISYSYTKAGLRKTMTTPDYEMQYHYDNVGRYKQIDRKVSGNWKKLADYEYNGLGQRTLYTRYDNTGLNDVVHTEYSYLPNIGWLQKVSNKDSTNAEISAYQYYETNQGDKNDLVGNRKYMKYNSTDYIEYEYDDLYRLTTETRKLNGTQSAKYQFTYDQAGNRLTQSRYTTSGIWASYHTYEYNDANQLTYERQFTNSGMGTDTKATRYRYNDLGNLTEKDIETNDFTGGDYEDFEYNEEEWDYGYDAYSRLIDVEKDSNQVADYTFNVLGNRVMKETSSETFKMLYDGYDCVADYADDDYDTLLRYYVTPNLDENLMVYDDAGDDEEHFYIHDGLGTVRQIVDASSNVENTYDYEGFGTGVSQTENIYNRFRYTGREYDAETEATANDGTGLYYYRARTYDSTIGAFTSRDPIPYTNLYPYCAANPIILIDPLGQTFYFGSAFGALTKHSASGDIKEVLAKPSDEETDYDLTDEETDEEGFEPDPTFYKGKTTGYGLTGDKAKWGAGAEIEDALDELKKVGKGDIWWFQGHSSKYEKDWHIEGDWSMWDLRSDYRTRLADEDDLSDAYGGKGGIIILESCYGNRIGAANAFKGADVLIYFSGQCELQKSEEITTYFFGALLAGKTISEAVTATKSLHLQMDTNDKNSCKVDRQTKDCCILNIEVADKTYKITDEFGNETRKKVGDMTLREYMSLADD